MYAKAYYFFTHTEAYGSLYGNKGMWLFCFKYIFLIYSNPQTPYCFLTYDSFSFCDVIYLVVINNLLAKTVFL